MTLFPAQALSRRRVRIAAAVFAASALAGATAMGATGETADPAGIPDETPVAVAGTPPPRAIGAELRRYLEDGKAILSAPLHWSGRSWAEAAGAVGLVAFLTTQDARIDRAVARHDSATATSVSKAVTPLGSYAAVGLSLASFGSGLLFHDAKLRDTGRDAIEAELFAAGIVTPILKATLGRSRPSQGADGDELRPFAGNQSFPSGHATEAFAVASVFAARSDGWVVPTIAYTLASGVALARMHDRAHYASDVVAGAVIGTAIGQTVVRRHSGETPSATSAWTLVPIASKGGAGLGLHLASAAPAGPPEILTPAIQAAPSTAGGTRIPAGTGPDGNPDGFRSVTQVGFVSVLR